MTLAIPLLLDRNVLPLAELLTLCMDGQLYRIGDVFATPDTPDTPELRARAFALTRPGPAVADRGTAAWIHGTRASPPARPQVCIDPARRGRLPDGLDAHQHALPEGDTVTLAGLRVTTPLRTAADLALTLPRFGSAEALEVRHLLSLTATPVSELEAHLARSRRQGVARATARLPLVASIQLPAADNTTRRYREGRPRPVIPR